MSIKATRLPTILLLRVFFTPTLASSTDVSDVVRDTSMDGRTCGDLSNSTNTQSRVFELSDEEAKEESCTKMCSETSDCVAYSGNWDEGWCIGCSGTLGIVHDGAVAFKKVAAPTPAPTLAPTQAAFVTGNLGDNFCPEGYLRITDSSTCEEALVALDLWVGFAGVSSRAMDSIPTGCVYETNLGMIILNSHANGTGQDGIRPICALPPPTPTPTVVPTSRPTVYPTHSPTSLPTLSPTQSPTVHPTHSPTSLPTLLPTLSPTTRPLFYIGGTGVNVCPDGYMRILDISTCEEARDALSLPCSQCEVKLGELLSDFLPKGCAYNEASKVIYLNNATGSDHPSMALMCSLVPTPSPSQSPTVSPTQSPTPCPTPIPTLDPTLQPTPQPTVTLTPQPTASPTSSPTDSPTPRPTPLPTFSPTSLPTTSPTPQPTLHPTHSPTPDPTPQPETPDPTQPTLNLETTFEVEVGADAAHFNATSYEKAFSIDAGIDVIAAISITHVYAMQIEAIYALDAAVTEDACINAMAAVYVISADSMQCEITSYNTRYKASVTVLSTNTSAMITAQSAARDIGESLQALSNKLGIGVQLISEPAYSVLVTTEIVCPVSLQIDNMIPERVLNRMSSVLGKQVEVRVTRRVPSLPQLCENNASCFAFLVAEVGCSNTWREACGNISAPPGILPTTRFSHKCVQECYRTNSPTLSPTASPTIAHTPSPTIAPTPSPTSSPTTSNTTLRPSLSPTASPPTSGPTNNISAPPTLAPTPRVIFMTISVAVRSHLAVHSPFVYGYCLVCMLAYVVS